jgi:hypothetical protein
MLVKVIIVFLCFMALVAFIGAAFSPSPAAAVLRNARNTPLRQMRPPYLIGADLHLRGQGMTPRW